MKKIILTAGLVIMTQLLVAQDLNKAIERANERYEKYNTLLTFTPEQAEKIKNLLDGIEQKQEYVRVDANLSEDQKKEFTQKNEEAFQRYFVTILTDDQKAKYKTTLSDK